MSENFYGGQDVVLAPGSLRGYRVWCHEVGMSPSYLRSVTVPTYWPPRGPGPARCRYVGISGQWEQGLHLDKRVPGVNCQCGFYAVYRPMSYKHYVLVARPAWAYVEGSVRAFGRVCMGTAGFRAERMEIEALFGQNARYWAGMLDVPWFPTQEELMAEVPPPNVEHLTGVHVVS